MVQFNGDNADEICEPNLAPGEQKIVLVVHDESTFYANDGRQIINGMEICLRNCFEEERHGSKHHGIGLPL